VVCDLRESREFDVDGGLVGVADTECMPWFDALSAERSRTEFGSRITSRPST